jgi:hypothetical protein
MGDEVFLMHKCFCATRTIVCGVQGNFFHGAKIVYGVYKVEVKALMLPNAPLIFPNYKDELTQLLLNQLQGQFTLWESAMM